MVLYQDKAPGHVGKDTISFIKKHNINVIMSHKSLPKSPGAARMGYSIRDAMKERVRKHRINTEMTKKSYKS